MDVSEVDLDTLADLLNGLVEAISEMLQQLVAVMQAAGERVARRRLQSASFAESKPGEYLDLLCRLSSRHGGVPFDRPPTVAL